MPFTTVLWLNDGNGAFTVAGPAVFEQPLGTLIGATRWDADGDGVDDLLTTDPAGVALLQSGNPVRRLALTGERLTTTTRGPLHAGDLDGDAYPEIVIAGTELQRNDGRGGFELDATGAWSNATQAPMLLADADRDGDLDAVLGGAMTASLQLNDGAGRFVAAPAGTLPAPSATVVPLASGDVDADGDLDLVVATGIEVELWRSHGGRFAADPAAWRGPPPAGSSAASLVDVDLDGALDLVVGREFGQTELWRNDGAGVFTDVTAAALPLVVHGTRALTAVDLDGDRAPEIVHAVELGPDVVWRNDGGGTFVEDPAALPASAASSTAVASFDADGDGACDLVFAGGPVVAFRNRGDGSFETATPEWIGAASSDAIATADVDLDGDHDLILASSVLLNTSRQLTPTLRGARLGRSFRVAIEHRGLGSLRLAYLGVGLRPIGPLSIPPFGWFHLDPATSVFLPPVPIGPSQILAVRELRVLDDVTLLGRVVHAQAAIAGLGGPPALQLTGVVDAEITR